MTRIFDIPNCSRRLSLVRANLPRLVDARSRRTRPSKHHTSHTRTPIPHESGRVWVTDAYLFSATFHHPRAFSLSSRLCPRVVAGNFVILYCRLATLIYQCRHFVSDCELVPPTHLAVSPNAHLDLHGFRSPRSAPYPPLVSLLEYLHAGLIRLQ